MGSLTKHVRARLHGKKLKSLYDDVYSRDGGKCVICGKPIEYGVKFHHEPCGPYKEDMKEKTVMLCQRCHYCRHNMAAGEEIRAKCTAYLKGLYGEKGAAKE